MQIKTFTTPLSNIASGEEKVNAFLKTVSNPRVSISCSPATEIFCACVIYMVSYTEEAKNYREPAGR